MAVVEWKKDGTVAIMIMNTSENRHNPDFAADHAQGARRDRGGQGDQLHRPHEQSTRRTGRWASTSTG